MIKDPFVVVNPNANTGRLGKNLEKSIALAKEYLGDFEYATTEGPSHEVELAQKAVKLDPGSASKWDTLAWLYFESGEKDKALKAMRKAVELRPDSEGYKQNLEKMEKGIS